MNRNPDPAACGPLLSRMGLIGDQDAIGTEPLRGGLWNDVFRVRGSAIDGTDIDWVVKIFNTGGQESLFPSLPADEARALATLTGLDVAPPFVAFEPAIGGRPVLVYGFHAGEPWHDGTERVAALFRRQHGPAADGFRRLAIEPAAILDEGDALIASFPAEPMAQRLRAARPAVGPVPPLARRCLVHTDAGPGNLIDGPDGLRLIDWQCPGLGDAAEDLFSFLSPAFMILFRHAPLTVDERASFLSAYGDRDAIERLTAMEPYFAYRMLAYCVRRRIELEAIDRALAARYTDAFDAQIAQIEGR